MNESIERDAEDMGTVKTQTEQDVIVETLATPASEPSVTESPFGSARTVVEEEAVRELAPILDLPDPEIPAPEVASAPAEEYELPRVAEPEVEAPAVEETAPVMGAEESIYEDPMFGRLKRVLADFIGEG